MAKAKVSRRETIQILDRHRKSVPKFSQSQKNEIRKCLGLSVGPKWDQILVKLRSELGMYLAMEAARGDVPTGKVKGKACRSAARKLKEAASVLFVKFEHPVKDDAYQWLEDGSDLVKEWPPQRRTALCDEIMNLAHAYEDAATAYRRSTKPRTTSSKNYLASLAACVMADHLGKWPSHAAHYKFSLAIAKAATGQIPPGLRDVCKEHLTFRRKST